ncbi:hypothetical protein L210DRAFT_3399167 [Boletus edulis BED1]|uniref:Protein kinase domain-containing protein n=1 Tax=Boletus edulis BED1 TaxID=1328754 RepID=A0AAD4BXC2_BOLED|nr:hypothetical protein L210DRAFT_3399167 [Boletus edulis BED1]
MLTPSPLRQRAFSPPVHDPEQDDIFLQSPFKSPPPVHRLYPQRVHKQPVPINDDEGNIFLSPSSVATSPFFPAPTSQPLRTPVKEELRSMTRSVLRSKQLNAQSQVASTSAVPGTGVGTKRKSSARSGGFSTPLRQTASTPLSISAANADPASGVAFHRLAPLPAPRFGIHTPQSKAETEAHLKGQAETMKRLRIRDMENSDEDWGVIEDDDSAYEVEERNSVPTKKPLLNRLPLLSRRSKNQLRSPRKPLTIKAVPQKGSALDEVTEAISPGGHILKRRARSRPLSLELLESVNQTSSPSASSHLDTSSPKHRPLSKSPPVTFPSVTRNQTSVIHSVPPPSASDSPMPRRRLTGGSRPPPFLQTNAPHGSPRGPMARLASTSSASLFFGPSILQSTTKTRSHTASNTTASSARPRVNAHTLVSNRHSYAGSGAEAIATFPWRSSLNIPSPDSSPVSVPHGSHDDEDDMFFEPCGPLETSFVFSVTEGTPSPRSKGQKGKDMLPLKYKPRDSGVALSDDEGDASNSLSAMPQASTSSSLNSDIGDDLITPGAIPGLDSGWPPAFVISGSDDDHRIDGVDVDAFILRTLAAGGKPSTEEPKKPPGTPVKKLKSAYLGGNRPWQSAVAAKVGFNFGGLDLGVAPGGKMKNGPRKSLPAAFPPLGFKKGADLQGSDEDEDEMNSPSTRKEASKYEGLGLGRPPVSCGPAGPVERTRWLMRRSSSGAFSSGSEASLATPTRRSKDWPILPRVPTHISPTAAAQLHIHSEKPGSRSSSNSSVITLNSPTLVRRQAPGLTSQRLPVSPLQHIAPTVNDKLGRFDKEFIEIDQIGSGEFGKVLKVRSKNGPSNSVSAVKRSKPFEGPRHRLRLREEVDVLQHLSRAVAAEGGHHPNVLAYIDSWEEDETLFIQTELCELGNLARFLWEYGKVFPRLDEARVWKIFADLSNGLRFIHESGVIHLDLKPANIFVTQEGRFKIGDFGMASLWPRVSGGSPLGVPLGGFEREGDKVYLAPEVLQGTYGRAADVFSLGMTMLETATNIVVPDQGDRWHRLRQEDFGQVDLERSPELFDLIKSMMRTDPSERVIIQTVHSHHVIRRARLAMERMYSEAKTTDSSLFGASPLASVSGTFLEEILGRRSTVPYYDDVAMDLSP